jgi:hypothetical protein
VYEINPTFSDADDQIISSGDLRIIRQNAMLVDALSFRPVPMLDNSAALDTGTPGFYKSGPTFRIAKYYFRFRAGMTTLTIKGRTTAPSGVTVKIYLNDSGTASATISAPQTSFTSTITISGLGFTVGQIIPILIKAEGSGNTSTATFYITSCYVGPISKSGWPGVPTFSVSTLNETKLNQLCSAIDWVYDRLNIVPFVPNRTTKVQLLQFRSGSWPVWFGTVQRGFDEDVAVVEGGFTNVSSTGLRYKIYLAGSLVATGATQTPGYYEFSETISLSGVAVGSTAEVWVYGEVVTPGPQADWKFGRMSIHRAEANASTYYPIATTLPVSFTYGSKSPSALVSDLNAIANIVSTAKTRIDDAPHIFARAHALRHWYGYDEDTRGNLDNRAPVHFIRRGSRLVVRGKDVKLGWGFATLARDDQGVNYDGYTYSRTEQIIDGDKVDTREVYLDSYPDLYPDRLYFLFGDVYYAEELLS